MLQKLPRSFYERETTTVAQELLGAYVVHQSHVGKIVEVEAYLGSHDLACHSSKGITPRTQIMFGPAGHAYIYLIYGMYFCTNIVTEKEGIGSAVLIRALEPINNIKLQTNGPGLLSKAMGIDKTLNGHDLTAEPFYICYPETKSSFTIVKKPRIGIHYAQDWVDKPLRFYIKDNAFISRP